MKRTHKPVHKCHKCGLNLGDRCGVYEYPHDMWHHDHRRCPGYKNEEMLKRYQEQQAKHPPDSKKKERREVAKKRDTESHHQGTLPLRNR
jgi:hypothetical protein